MGLVGAAAPCKHEAGPFAPVQEKIRLLEGVRGNTATTPAVANGWQLAKVPEADDADAFQPEVLQGQANRRS